MPGSSRDWLCVVVAPRGSATLPLPGDLLDAFGSVVLRADGTLELGPASVAVVRRAGAA